MKTVMIGASGLVGGSLYRLLKLKKHEVLGTYNTFKVDGLSELDITSSKQTNSLIYDYKPEVVFLPAAMADVDRCEKDPVLCRKVNFDGMVNVIEASMSVKSCIVFFSTDYVFDGVKRLPTEEDYPNPLNIYGKIKLEVEKYIREKANNFLIIRTANVYGWETQGKNYVMRLINTLSKGETVKAFTDQYATPTYVENLTEAVLCLVEKGIKGLYHVCGSSLVTRYEFAREIAQVFGLNKDLIIPTTTSMASQFAKRPQIGGLSTRKVLEILPFSLLGVRDGLLRMLNERR